MNFRLDLLRCFELLDEESINYDCFLDIFLNVLNKHARVKQKILRGNQPRL